MMGIPPDLQAQIFDDASDIFNESTRIRYDTNYIKVYRDELTTRAFISRKQNGLSISDRLLTPGLKLKTNDNLLFGLGYTYSFLTLNLSVKLPFINRDENQYGKSRYVDLQSHSMFRSYLIDLYLQWNKGYYIANPERVYPSWNNGQAFPLRGDLRTSVVGLNIQHLFNSRRYSYKASFHQNEFQRKSAGSPIVGVEAYWVLALADSALFSAQVPGVNSLDSKSFNQVEMVNVGLNAGYAYTFVWQEKLNFSLSSVLGVSGGYNQVYHMEGSTVINSGLSLGINNLSRLSLGYNSTKYYVGLSYIRFSMSNLTDSPGDWISYSTGNLRFNVVKRFQLKKPIRIFRPDLWSF